MPTARSSTRAGSTLLVDVSSLAYRAFFAVPDTVRAPDGRAVNAVHGFLSMLARLIGDLRPALAGCALDADWRPQWRVDLVPSYKTHRLAAEADGEESEPIDEQIDLLARLLEVAGVPVVAADACEAEDVIAALARRAPGPVAIVSGDRDLFQLVDDRRGIAVLYPQRGVTDLARVDEAEIGRRYGIPGRAYADFATLRGDPSDGLPGVRGIGDKTAAALINTHGTLEAVLRAARGATSGPLAKVNAARDYLERAERIVHLDGSAPVGRASLRLRPPAARALATARRHGVDGPMRRLLAAIAPLARSTPRAGNSTSRPRGGTR